MPPSPTPTATPSLRQKRSTPIPTTTPNTIQSPATASMPATSLPPSTEPAICVRGVSHAYGQRTALADLSLDVARGELLAVLGPNGGGKTTLFRLLSTLLPLQSGSASVLGCDLRAQPQAIRQRIGVVFQAPSLDR